MLETLVAMHMKQNGSLVWFKCDRLGASFLLVGQMESRRSTLTVGKINQNRHLGGTLVCIMRSIKVSTKTHALFVLVQAKITITRNGLIGRTWESKVELLQYSSPLNPLKQLVGHVPIVSLKPMTLSLSNVTSRWMRYILKVL